MLDQQTFNYIINSQKLFSTLYQEKLKMKKLAHNKKMKDIRAEKRLLNPLPHPYKKSYFTSNVFKSKNPDIN
jgi:hypothetical protein